MFPAGRLWVRGARCGGTCAQVPGRRKRVKGKGEPERRDCGRSGHEAEAARRDGGAPPWFSLNICQATSYSNNRQGSGQSSRQSSLPWRLTPFWGTDPFGWGYPLRVRSPALPRAHFRGAPRRRRGRMAARRDGVAPPRFALNICQATSCLNNRRTSRQRN
jgi:hypothetical protein